MNDECYLLRSSVISDASLLIKVVAVTLSFPVPIAAQNELKNDHSRLIA